MEFTLSKGGVFIMKREKVVKERNKYAWSWWKGDEEYWGRWIHVVWNLAGVSVKHEKWKVK